MQMDIQTQMFLLYPTIGTHDDDSKCLRQQTSGFILEDLIGIRIPYGIGQDISNDITFIHMVSIIQEGGSTSDPQL